MTVHITINIDNEAFEEAGGSEVARILRELADRYDEEGFHIYEALRDSNGNRVGKAELLDC